MLERWSVRVVTAAAALAVSGAGVAAQETDEAAGESPERAQRWGFEMNLSLTSTSGNDRLTVFVTDGKVTHLQTQAYRLELTGRMRYGRSEGESVAQNMQGSLTLELAPAGRWSPFLFTQAEKDPFKRLDVRTSSGAGVRYKWLTGERLEASVSGATLHSYENFEVAATDPQSAETRQDARWRWIAEGTASLMEGVDAEHRTYYEPVWDRAGDYLMEVQNTLRFQVNDRLTFRVAHLFERNSQPQEGVARDDSMLTVGAGFRTQF